MTSKNSFFSNNVLSIIMALGGYGFLLNSSVIVEEMIYVGLSMTFSIACFSLGLYFVMKDDTKKEQANRGLQTQ